MNLSVDYVIIGAGIIGLSIARDLKRREPKSRIVVLEKEPSLGKHQSGRNSGVLHSGIYYPVSSLKAKVCAEGAQEMAAYCDEHKLPIDRIGKIILPVREGDGQQLEMLLTRARANGAAVEIVDEQQLKEVEPDARSITGKALYSPNTSVIDPKLVLNHLADALRSQGVEILMNRTFDAVRAEQSAIVSNGETFHYGRLFNTAGLHADRVAKPFGVGERYTILPFKGLYYRLAESAGFDVRHLIYPVPDLRVPFLGVHFTKSIDGHVYLGPTAVPAFGRENYQGLSNVERADFGSIMVHLCQQYVSNKQGFRVFAHEECVRFFKPRFAAAARSLVPKLQARHLVASDKVGIRAQLLDLEKKELVMDFLVEHGRNSTHILNAVSPAFTSAFSFARLVLDEIGVA